MPAKPMKIGLFGSFGGGNFGNDGSLEAMLGFLRQVRPDAELTCICARPDVVEREYGLVGRPMSWHGFRSGVARAIDRMLLRVPRELVNWFQTLRQVRKFDALIIPGTGILDDYATGPLGMPYALFVWCTAAWLSGTRVAFVSIGAGPIHHAASRWLMKSAARGARYRSYRDTISRDYMAGIGFDVRQDPVYPDIAFRLPDPPEPPATAAGGPAERPLVVAVGVMTYNGWRSDASQDDVIYEAYRAKITRFILWLLDRGHHVRILVGETSDQRAVDDVLQGVEAARPGSAGRSVLAEPSTSLHCLMRQIAPADIVVATRYHNVVCALKLCKPTVSIGYAAKNDVLMADMGIGAFCQHIEQLNVDQLIEQFTALLSDRRHYERVLQEAKAACRERLAQQDAWLVNNFLELDTRSDGAIGLPKANTPPPHASIVDHSN